MSVWELLRNEKNNRMGYSGGIEEENKLIVTPNYEYKSRNFSFKQSYIS